MKKNRKKGRTRQLIVGGVAGLVLLVVGAMLVVGLSSSGAQQPMATHPTVVAAPAAPFRTIAGPENRAPQVSAIIERSGKVVPPNIAEPRPVSVHGKRSPVKFRFGWNQSEEVAVLHTHSPTTGRSGTFVLKPHAGQPSSEGIGRYNVRHGREVACALGQDGLPVLATPSKDTHACTVSFWQRVPYQLHDGAYLRLRTKSGKMGYELIDRDSQKRTAAALTRIPWKPQTLASAAA